MPKKKKNKKNQKTISNLYLDRKTSHGGWPHGHGGSWNDKTPVNVQITNWLEKMGMLDDVPQARLSEVQLRRIIRNLLIEINTYSS